MASRRNFRRQLEGYGLTTAAILYRLPDHPCAAADLRLAGVRPLPEIPGAQRIPQLLAGAARRTAALGHGRAFAADQAGGDPVRGRRVPVALSCSHATCVIGSELRSRGHVFMRRRHRMKRMRTLSTVIRERASQVGAPSKAMIAALGTGLAAA